MNAPPTPFVPRRSDYEPIVQTFMPAAKGLELELRSALLLMRDRCVAVKPAACEESWQILDLVERTATRDAFRSMPLEELKRIRWTLLRLVGAASDFDAMFAPPLDLPEMPEEGGGARG